MLMFVWREKDTLTKRDRVRMVPREKYLSSTIAVSFPTAIRSVPLRDSKHRNRRHTLELRLRNRNLSAINSVDQAIYLPSSDH